MTTGHRGVHSRGEADIIAGLTADSPEDRTPTTTLAALLEKAVEQHGDRYTLTSATDSLTYEGLWERACRGAAELADRGVGRGDVVVICGSRTIATVVAVPAAILAGGAPLVLDAGDPEARRRTLLAIAKPRIALTEALGDDSVGVPTLELRRLGARGTRSAARPEVLPGDPAYVVFTSGSTGAPKAIVMPHRATSNLVQWQVANGAAGSDDRTALAASLGFDVLFQEIFATWAAGGELVVPDDQLRRDPEALLRWLDAEGIGRLFLPYVGLRSLARVAVELGVVVPSLREVITAGERLVVTDELRAFFAAHPGCSLVNQYGPAETHVATSYPLPEDARSWPLTPPIGWPIDGVTVRIWDEDGNDVPPGAQGELVVGGVAVADGYLGDDALTARKFVETPEGRLYRTGDQARQDPVTGVYEFCGRDDDQVKIRGYRVELAEVEAAIQRHPAVVEAAAVAATRDEEGPRLVAFAVASADGTDILRWLRAQVPAYLVPAELRTVPSLPVSPNGKVDRRRLLAEVTEDRHEPAPAPTGEALAERVAEVLARTLGVERVEPDESFFDAGGDSLLVVRAVSMLRSELGLDVSVSSFFEEPTADCVAAKAARRELVAVASEPAAGEDGARLASLSQESLWFIHQMQPFSSAYNVVSLFEVDGAVDPELLRGAVSLVAERHESLATIYPLSEGRLSAAPGPPPAVRVADLASPDELDEELLRRANEPFDLDEGPVMRWDLLRGPGRELLLVNTHHIGTDGHSEGIVFRDFAAAYDGLSADPSFRYPPEPRRVRYSDFARWQRDRCRGPVVESAVAHWRRCLDGAPVETSPVGPLAGTPSGTIDVAVLREDVDEWVGSVVGALSVSPFSVFLGVWAHLLSARIGQSDLVIGVPASGRTEAAVDDVVGYFVNALPLRIAVEDPSDVRATILQANRVVGSALERQDVPFHLVVRELQPPRAHNRNPVFQTMFQLDPPPAPLQLAGATLQPIGQPPTHAQFDLNVRILWGGPRTEIWSYCDRSNRAEVDALLASYVALLRDVAAPAAVRAR